MAVFFFPGEKLLIQFLFSRLFDQLFCKPNPFIFRQISDISHHAVPVVKHLIPALAGNKIAPSGVVMNTKIRKGQFMPGVSDAFHLRHLTMRACGFLPEESA